MKRLLIFGLSGQVGSALLEHPSLSAFRITALSRRSQTNRDGLCWLSGSLQAMPELPPTIDAVLSLGPLDAFADWFDGSRLRSVRVIALGSSGVISKADSPDGQERALAVCLAHAEARLRQAAIERDSALTLLRPTLIYGHGQDRSLTPLIALARRWCFLPLPSGDGGLRQPVHAQDVAQAVLDCLDQPRTCGGTYDLPGGETLPMKVLIRRALDRYAPNTRLFSCPDWTLALAIKVVSSAPTLSPGWRSAAGFLARWHQDQLFDAGPAQRAFGYRPGPFLL
jgi:nucleoside-diphosphate-sugar epimerase